MTTKPSIFLWLVVASAILAPLQAISGASWDKFQGLSGSQAGQTVEGLSELKLYLKQFGYIDPVNPIEPPEHPIDLSDFFDAGLESAVRLYQSNFHLQVTGTINDETLHQMMQPRCGLPDILDGINNMDIRNNGSVSIDGDIASIAHYTFFYPFEPHWRNRTNLSYAFRRENKIPGRAKSVFEQAFARWAPFIPFNFTETEIYDRADIKIDFSWGDHGDGFAFDGPTGVLAHSFRPTDGRMHLDYNETWVYDGDVRKALVPTAVDLESVAMHQIGHILGLGHTSEPTAIMYPPTPFRTKKVDLTNDDIQGIQYLYSTYYANYSGNMDYHSQTAGDVPSSLWCWTLWIGFTGLLWFLIY